MEHDIARINTIIRIATSPDILADEKAFYDTVLNAIGVLFNAKTAMLLLRKMAAISLIQKLSLDMQKNLSQDSG